MSDLSVAKNNLDGHTLALCKGDKILLSDKRGVAQMFEYLRTDTDLKGYSAADTIVGKAVASMFVLCGVVAVFAKVISRKGLEYLQNHGAYVEYEVLTDSIINRQGTGVCPMEQTVEGIEEAQECYEAILKKIVSMR